MMDHGIKNILTSLLSGFLIFAILYFIISVLVQWAYSNEILIESITGGILFSIAIVATAMIRFYNKYGTIPTDRVLESADKERYTIRNAGQRDKLIQKTEDIAAERSSWKTEEKTASRLLLFKTGFWGLFRERIDIRLTGSPDEAPAELNIAYYPSFQNAKGEDERKTWMKDVVQNLKLSSEESAESGS